MDNRLRVSVDHLLEGVQVIDTEWRYVYLNAAAATQAQRTADELVGRTMMECYPGIEQTELFCTLQRVMNARRPETMRNEFAYPTGERRWFDLMISPVPDGICVLSLDITERRRIELESHHVQRLEALGRLAGGIAHDFNNQLTAILGFTDLLLDSHRDKQSREDLGEIREAATRSAALTRELLAFSRRQALKIEPMDLNAVVSNMTRLLDRLLGAHVSCEMRLHDDPTMILGDAQQLENALTNLAANARDAMPKGGRLTIATGVVELTDEDARQHATMTSGRYAVLSVADTGYGMDEATRARIFEPFFTTKEQGKGTGLGLAAVYGTVKQMGGFIWVYSEVNHGTTFRIYFPTTTETQRPKAAHRPTRVQHRHAAILVIEDDARVRDFTIRALSKNGYRVVGAATAEEAHKRLDEMTRPPDLVLADVVLPGTLGPDLISQLTLGRTKVLFMSGYSERHLPNRSLSAIGLLEKPFTAEELLQAVDGTLARE